jgi:hypothetical protein
VAEGLKLVGWPRRMVKPSTSARPGTWNGTIPSRLSNEWFSIISITMWSIFGIVAVPAGRWGNGRLSGLRRAPGLATGLAQAGSPPDAISAAPPAAPRRRARRVSLLCAAGEVSITPRYITAGPRTRPGPRPGAQGGR